MIISAIVAVAKNNVIGAGNTIPWYLPADLKFFKRTTLNHHIIMGRKCYESIGRPLPKRTNVIITRNPYYLASNCLVAHTIEEAIQVARDNQEEEAFIIGGGEIYRQSESLWDRLYLTKVDLEVKGEITFQEVSLDDWNLTSEEAHPSDEKNKHPYTFYQYDRKK